jgi:hypothetical protein
MHRVSNRYRHLMLRRAQLAQQPAVGVEEVCIRAAEAVAYKPAQAVLAAACTLQAQAQAAALAQVHDVQLASLWRVAWLLPSPFSSACKQGLMRLPVR